VGENQKRHLKFTQITKVEMYMKKYEKILYFGCGPFPVTVANKGL